MTFNRRMQAALAALLLTFMATLALGTVDRAICTTADAGATCSGTELVTSANEEIGGLDNRAYMLLGTVAGTNTITANVTPTLTALADGQRFRLKPANTNTGATTLAINAIAAKSVVSISAAALTAGDLQSTSLYDFTYFAASDHFRVMTPLGAGGTANLSFGTYTATLFNITNVAASTAYVAQWMRVGDVVTVSGKFDIDVTTTATFTILTMTLPVASSLTATEQVGGVASEVGGDAAPTQFGVMADIANDRAAFQGMPGTAANHAVHFSFTYRLL